MIVALLFASVAVCFACWLLFTLATLALPFFSAVTAGLWAYRYGAGAMGALVVGLIAGVLTLTAGQLLFALVRSPLSRLAIGLLFAAPAAITGYHAVHGITGMGIESEAWRQVRGIIGASFIGGAAWLRLAGSGDVARRIEHTSRSRG